MAETSRPSPRARPFRVAGIAVVAATLLAGCFGSEEREVADPAPAGGPTAADVALARQLYENESCTMCHGPDGAGTDLAPPLRDLAGYWDEDRLVRYLEDPAAFRESDPDFDGRRDIVYDMDMPAYGHVPPGDRRALARWLLTR